VIGLLAGLAIVCGPMIIALGSVADIAVPIGWGLLALFATIGLAAGTFASESQPKDSDEPSDERRGPAGGSATG
jgi:hypothetical protein